MSAKTAPCGVSEASGSAIEPLAHKTQDSGNNKGKAEEQPAQLFLSLFFFFLVLLLTLQIAGK